jgi:phosphopantetheine adenylyltransferase
MFSLFPQFNEAGEQQDIGVQIDWMVGKIDWLTFSYFSDVPSEDEPLLKGLHRTQLIHALVLAMNHSFSHTKGVRDKESGQIVAFSKEEILELLSRLYRNTITFDDTQNFNTLYDWMQNIDEEDRNKVLRAYLKILDTTRGNKDLSGERCGYIPKVLEQMYLSLLKSGQMKGKFLCKEANPTLWAAVNDSIQESLNNNEKITVVIPGGFKPPHRGHVEMINHFANLPNVDEVIIFTGSKERQSDDGSVVITSEKARKLFNLFDLAPNVRFGDIRQREKMDGNTYENPFMDAIDVLFDEKYTGKNVAIGHPTKDPTYADRFEKIASYSKKPMVANLVKVTPADTTDGLSATDLRNAVQNGDTEKLEKFIPDNIAKDYLKILIGDL